MRRLELHWKIIIGMGLGMVYGLIASKMGWLDFTNDWIKPLVLELTFFLYLL